MSRNDKKRGLLGNERERVEMEEEWIELDDFRTTPNPYVVDKKPSHHKKHYERLQDQHSLHHHHSGSSGSHHSGSAGSVQGLPKHRQAPFNPDVITLNGDTFKLVGSKAIEKPKAKKSNIPVMHVACSFCTVVQSIPGTSQVFVCGTCSKMNQCDPVYGIFICCTCQSKVLYATGTSSTIRCTKCSTINQVPNKKHHVIPGNLYMKEADHENQVRMSEIDVETELISQRQYREKDYRYPDL